MSLAGHDRLTISRNVNCPYFRVWHKPADLRAAAIPSAIRGSTDDQVSCDHCRMRQKARCTLLRRSVLPEVLEPFRRQLGVAYCMHDVLVPEVVLESPRVTPIVGQLVATGMAKHVWMHWELKLGSDRQTRKQLSKPRRRHRAPRALSMSSPNTSIRSPKSE